MRSQGEGRRGIGMLAVAVGLLAATPGCISGAALTVKEAESKPIKFGVLATAFALEAGLFLALEGARDDDFGWYYAGTVGADMLLALAVGRCESCYGDLPTGPVGPPTPPTPPREVSPREAECNEAGRVMGLMMTDQDDRLYVQNRIRDAVSWSAGRTNGRRPPGAAWPARTPRRRTPRVSSS